MTIDSKHTRAGEGSRRRGRWDARLSPAVAHWLTATYGVNPDVYHERFRQGVLLCAAIGGKPFADIANSNRGLAVFILLYVRLLTFRGQNAVAWLLRALPLKRRNILREMGLPASESLVKLLGRLDPCVGPGKTGLLRRTVADDTPNVLRHLKCITEQQIAIACHPEVAQCVTDAFVQNVPEFQADAGERLVHLIGTYARLKSRYESNTGKRLRPVSDLDELFEYMARAERHFWREHKRTILRANGSFPMPPIPPTADGAIRAVLRPEALAQIARRLDNCAADYLSSAKNGEMAFYLMSTPEDGLIAIDRHAGGELRLSQASGPRNSRLSRTGESFVIDWFAAGSRSAHIPVRRDSWFEGSRRRLQRLLRWSGLDYHPVCFREELLALANPEERLVPQLAGELQDGISLALIPKESPGSFVVLARLPEGWRISRIIGKPPTVQFVDRLCTMLAPARVKSFGTPRHVFSGVSFWNGPRQPDLPLTYRAAWSPELDLADVRRMTAWEFRAEAGRLCFPVKAWLTHILMGTCVPVSVEVDGLRGIFVLSHSQDTWSIAASVCDRPFGAPAPCCLWARLCESLKTAGVAIL